ncbi:putative zinc finger protein [Phaeoacremonium minimum UCRPA7]|uniref:Putative zinc finger protein n=1 Tax=Phaeoacremonium minimum (strain UCR-PA7) TaxID=1286976 RepID=R8BBY9_PHAM7|nr:putative zinc finger protein [Phaeoacremonium minimum UCRPA7]EON96817.1 putative zinc finger protein [Phaeoacremonium minimum UCRPA7]
MARRDSPPDSPLSSMASSDAEVYDDDVQEDVEETELPPAKRLKLGGGSTASSAIVAEPDPEPDPLEGIDVSSDSSGDIPSSPINVRLEEDDFQEQVTVCAWEGCKAGDLKNMDKLVEHIHNDHIEGRQKKYTCEWIGCNRKSMPHASGYALKAHMRSHTREKPFYCYLPECDRAFTRSDALAKHMRTVHETEALRPSDPVPKSMQAGGGPAGKSAKLKIIIKTPQSHAAGQDDAIDDGSNADDIADLFTPLTEEQGFTAKEIALPLEQLHSLCRRQVRWAEKDGEELKKQCKKWEDVYKKAWLEKEVLLDQVIKSEMDWYGRRRQVLSGVADVVVNGAGSADEATVTVENGGVEAEKEIEVED